MSRLKVKLKPRAMLSFSTLEYLNKSYTFQINVVKIQCICIILSGGLRLIYDWLAPHAVNVLVKTD